MYTPSIHTRYNNQHILRDRLGKVFNAGKRCVALLLAVIGAVLSAYSSTADMEDIKLPPYVKVLDCLPSGETEEGRDVGEFYVSDADYYRDAARTIFRVNRTELNYSDPLLRLLQDSILPLANRNGWALVHIDLRGAASPEGPYDNNVRLANGRAAALKRFLRENLDSIVERETFTQTIAEDYPYLSWLLNNAGDGAAPRVDQIIRRCQGDPVRIKEELKKVRHGEMWDRLLRDYYPYVRSARVMFFFRRCKPVPALEFNVPAETGGAGRLTSDELPMPGAPFPFPVTLERPHMFSLGTNLLYDAFWMPGYGWAPMPNLTLEWFPRNSKWTLKAGFTFPYYHRWNKQKFFQIRDYHLEGRYYFAPQWIHKGWYLGAYVNATKYGIGLGKKRGWQGEGMGGALKGGYVLPLGSGRWRMDFHVAVGTWYTAYDPYVYGNPVTGQEDGDYYYDYTGLVNQFKKRNHHRWWFGPTEIGITVSYDLLYYRLRKSGASVLRKEVVE